jgi:hypothetical protein
LWLCHARVRLLAKECILRLRESRKILVESDPKNPNVFSTTGCCCFYKRNIDSLNGLKSYTISSWKWTVCGILYTFSSPSIISLFSCPAPQPRIAARFRNNPFASLAAVVLCTPMHAIQNSSSAGFAKCAYSSCTAPSMVSQNVSGSSRWSWLVAYCPPSEVEAASRQRSARL